MTESSEKSQQLRRSHAPEFMPFVRLLQWRVLILAHEASCVYSVRVSTREAH